MGKHHVDVSPSSPSSLPSSRECETDVVSTSPSNAPISKVVEDPKKCETLEIVDPTPSKVILTSSLMISKPISPFPS